MIKAPTMDEQHTEAHDTTIELLNHFSTEFQKLFVDFVLQATLPENENKTSQFRVVSSQFASAMSTLSSILKLSNSLSLRMKDSLILTRVFYETCLSASFISLDDGDRANEAELFSVFKTFEKQTHVRKSSNHMLKIAREPRISRDDPIVAEAIKMFGKGSKQKPNSRISRETMISEITEFDKQSGLFLLAAEELIYELSSEIIHGTYYGYFLFYGSHNTKNGEIEYLETHFQTVVFALMLSAIPLIRSINNALAPNSSAIRLEEYMLEILACFDQEKLGPAIKKFNNLKKK